MSDPRKPSPEAQKKVYYLVASFAAVITLYTVLFKLEYRVIIDCLYLVTSVLFVVYFYMSYGFAKTLPTKEELNPAWQESRREKFAERIRRNKEYSKKLIYPLVPLMAVMAFDMIYRAFFATNL
ncbi:MAG: hypothetical protein IJW46_05050 [Clostridia bacterium]|nr:hypothetical protein [Clostridia bacterium]